jgi:beta-glucanase (GH16 family)
MGNNVAAGKEPDIAVLSNPDVINIVDGNLRLTPISYTDESNPNIKYGVPASVRTRDKMGYRYGYAEIRAKVPFKQGVWPSFWTLPSTGLGEINCKKYGVEVDIFEVFGSVNTITPQIHKWYADDYDYNAIHGGNVEDNHTKWNAGATYAFNDFSNLSNEYHTYGFEWTPTEMSMYVDGVCYQTYDITTSYDNCSDTTGFHDARYIIFNNHVFSPNSEWIPEGGSVDQFENNLPANYDIDYFRLYQSEEFSNSKVWLKH